MAPCTLVKSNRVAENVIKGKEKECLEAISCLNSHVQPGDNDRIVISQHSATTERAKEGYEKEEVLFDLALLGLLELMIELRNACSF